MKRRDVLILGVLPLVPALAQQPARLPLIGVLVTHAALNDQVFDRLRKGLREYGYEDGKNIKLEIVTAAGQMEHLPAIAERFVRMGADIIICPNEPSTRTAMNATKTIPIVMLGFSADPVAAGIVDSFGRPKGNVTGIHVLPEELDSKRLEILKDAVPTLNHVAVFWHRPFGERAARQSEEAGKAMGMRVDVLEIKTPDELEPAFATALMKGERAVSVTWSPMFYMQRERIGEIAMKRRVPVIAVYGSESPGHLLSYGTDGWLTWRRAGYYVHRLLTGTKVTELPVEQVSTFKLFANMRAAKTLGIKLPQSVLVRAEDVLE